MKRQTQCPFDLESHRPKYRHPDRVGDWILVSGEGGYSLWRVTLQSLADPDKRVEVRSTDPFFEVMAWERAPVMRGGA
jgi:hypothetical protein